MEEVRTGLAVLFTMAAAWQDLKKREIALWVFGVFGAAAVFLLFAELACGGSWGMYLAGMLPGCFLLLCSGWTREEIGLGDGIYFCISGLLIGFWRNLALFMGSVFLCGLSGAVWYLWQRLRTGICAGKERLPFLPFCAASMALQWLLRQRVQV